MDISRLGIDRDAQEEQSVLETSLSLPPLQIYRDSAYAELLKETPSQSSYNEDNGSLVSCSEDNERPISFNGDIDNLISCSEDDASLTSYNIDDESAKTCNVRVGNERTFPRYEYTDETLSDASSTSLVWIPREVPVPVRDASCHSSGPFEQNGQISNGYSTTSTSTLSISHVTYVVKETVGPWWKGAGFKNARRKIILNDISMQLKSGEITAILGNSGSGKTSLLDVVTGRSKGTVSGDVLFNNVTCTHDVIKQHAAYVMQADRLLPNLTVRETLRYSARLNFPGGTSNHVIEDKVTSVIMEMGLKDVADSRIGSGVSRGISGGEQRRVTIAIQLLKDPDLVLLDEPTSGLDGYTARYLVSNLRDLARRGKIVLLSIHQPSSDIFQFFDQIALMSVGKMVYCGPAKSLVPYFTNLGYPCDRYTNPLDRYVDVASIDRRDSESEKESLKRVAKLVKEFKSSVFNQMTEKSIEENSRKKTEKAPTMAERNTGRSNLRILLTVLGRMNKNLFRDRNDYIWRLFLLPFAIMFVPLFVGKLKHTQSSIQDRVGVLYNSCTVPAFVGLINSLPLFPSLRDLYYREAMDGLYGPATFLTAYSIHIVPFHAVSSLFYSNLIYWITGLQPEVHRFLYYTLTAFLLNYWGEILSVTCMGMFMNANLANSVAGLLLTANVTIGAGLVKDINTMIKPFQWISWAMIYKYVAEIYVTNEFSGLKFTDCPANVTAACFHEGEQYIDRYFPDAADHLTRNFAVTGAHVVGMFILAVLLYKLKGPKTLH